ncbi:MAG: DUF1549 domain-containing protein [Planctomycetales bacterium]|nr:DUF1549 domain-containing protein [Planctomycetales bacterium]
MVTAVRGNDSAGVAVGLESPVPDVYPHEVRLLTAESRQQLVVTARHGGRGVDVTRDAIYRSEDPEVVRVDDGGVLHAVAAGTTQVVVNDGSGEQSVTVEVNLPEVPRPVVFERDIQPILTFGGCNMGACHAKQGGQNGFQLSLFGFDDEFDYAALTKDARGRRVFPAAADESLLLLKATAAIPHGGGQRFARDSSEYIKLRSWITSGMPRRPDDAAVLDHISVYPTECLLAPESSQQLIVTAHYSDGTSEDVTTTSSFQSNEGAIADVARSGEHEAGAQVSTSAGTPLGLIRSGAIPGEAAIMARYMGEIAVCNVGVPLPGTVPDDVYAQLPSDNAIDRLVWEKLQRLGMVPSPRADEATLLRRAYIDVIGRLPTPDETRDYLADSSPDKWPRLIEFLLDRPEYADHWANKWVDLLRPNPYRVGIKAVLNYDDWIRRAYRENRPYDEFVRGLIAAQGSTFHNGAATLFRDRRAPDELTTMVSQLFLGIRLECAKCHHHPFEVWGQDDFYSFAAYFSRIGYKGTGLSPPISGSEEIVFTADNGNVRHPLTDAVMQPKTLFGESPEIAADDDPREALARWVTADDNAFFSRVLANRVWADLMGRGLVEPVDDLRGTNPASNEPLLAELGDEFRRGRYDLKHLIRAIMLTHVYQLSDEPNERNVMDTRNYSRHYRQRLRAEVLLDAVCDTTGVAEKLPAMPAESLSKQIWTHRVDSLFLDAFGRPDPNQDPPCERTSETTMVQTLHLMNSPELQEKITSDEGRAAELAASQRSPAEIVEEVYLAVYSRRPDDEELAVCQDYFTAASDRRQATEDLLWSLLNTPEFIFKN